MGTFRYLDSSPEVIRLVVMFYMKCVHFAEKNVEDPLAERSSDARHEKNIGTRKASSPMGFAHTPAAMSKISNTAIDRRLEVGLSITRRIHITRSTAIARCVAVTWARRLFE
jgi:hypothetical protein